jgi:hypothetical protein
MAQDKWDRQPSPGRRRGHPYRALRREIRAEQIACRSESFMNNIIWKTFFNTEILPGHIIYQPESAHAFFPGRNDSHSH